MMSLWGFVGFMFSNALLLNFSSESYYLVLYVWLSVTITQCHEGIFRKKKDQTLYFNKSKQVSVFEELEKSPHERKNEGLLVTRTI